VNAANFAMAAALAAAATCAFGQTQDWQIDSAHSTASLSLVSSSHANRPFNIAVAMVAGVVNLDENAATGPSLRLSIYPAGQDASLLNRDGSFRTGGLAALSTYTLATFQSKKAVVTGDRKIEFTGDLMIVHVRREAAVAWSNAYAGAVSTEPVANTMMGEVTFVIDVSTLRATPGQPERSAETAAWATVPRHDFKGLVAALRDSNWPMVVLDEACRMPYYSGPFARDYHGPSCTGTPVEPAVFAELPYYLAADSVGTDIPVPPSGDELTILADLHLRPARSGMSAGPRN
jgi:polyisoprenoid-binding protein YceI